MSLKLLIIPVVGEFDKGLLDGAVHELDFAVPPRVARFSQARFDVMFVADPIGHMPAVDDYWT